MQRLIVLFSILIFSSTSVAESDSSSIWNETELTAMKRLHINEYETPREYQVNRVAQNEDAAVFGHRIFFDRRFSANGKVACATCHIPELYFTDGLTTSKGLRGVSRNAPTIVGKSQSFWLFRDGRRDSLWSQAMEPFETGAEHGVTRNYIAHEVARDENLREQYETIFGSMPDLSDKTRFPLHAGPVNNRTLRKNWNGMSADDQKTINTIFTNITKSIAAYEIKLKPAASRFDNYVDAVVQGDEEKQKASLTNDEIAGLKLFLNKGNCVICHNGPMFSDFGFHNIATPPVDVKRYDWGRFKGMNRLLKNEFNCYSEYSDDKAKNCDEIKYMIRHREHLIGLFRTPSLRNVSKTAPYMHAGQYETLKDVIKHYDDPPSTKIGQSDLIPFPVDFNDVEISQLEAFLKALDSDIDAEARWLKDPN